MADESRDAVSELKLAGPDRPLELFPYQIEGADWLARRERAGLLDAPGVGKSCQTVRALDLRRAKRGIIVCPAHLRENWLAEIRKFSHFERRVCKGRTIHDFVAWSREVFDILVISFELAVKWADRIHDNAEILDFLVVDEFHYLNNLETARAKAIIGADGDGAGGIAQWACQTWLLTGTLMSNDPSNIFAFLCFVRAIEMPFATFVRRYFTSRASTWGSRNKPRPNMVFELQQLLQGNSIRRTLEQVGYQLPPIFLTTTLVDGDTKQIRDLLGEHPGLDAAIVAAVESGGLSFLDAQHIATMRRLIAEAKAVPYTEMLLAELAADPDRKVVVMGNSREALITVRDLLTARGVWCVLIQGGVSETLRIDAVSAFQSNPKCRVFIGNMRSAGTGLTLTAAAHIDILESDWTPAANDQAIKRIRRIGQKQIQHARFITLARSLDVVVTRVLVEKTANIAAIEGEPMLATAGEEA
jgi:SWI/SNF-related matrix-associated actin-dependent regulator 1 of chromatin subfamily A